VDRWVRILETGVALLEYREKRKDSLERWLVPRAMPIMSQVRRVATSMPTRSRAKTLPVEREASPHGYQLVVESALFS
jgi:hypothetical protein